MTRTRNRLAIGAVLLASAALVTAAAVSAPAHADQTRPVPGLAATVAGAGRAVTLPTGERFVVRDAAGHITVSPAPGASVGAVDVVRSGSHVYALPRSIAPALARLDLSLFDVADGSPSRTVRIDFAGAIRSVPGVRITGHPGSTATGTITDPAAFAAALTAGVPGVAHIAAARPSVAPPPGATPAYPMSTLTIRVADLPASAGRLLAAVVSAQNLDDLRRADLSTETGTDGTARLSVPDGHYLLWGLVITDPTGGAGRHYRTARIPVRTDVTVNGATQATLDPNQATVHAAFTLTRPTALLDVESALTVSDGVRDTGLFSSQGTDDTNTLYQPTTPAPVGRVGFVEFETRATGTRTPDPVQYDVGWEWTDRVPADPARTLSAADLTPVTDRFYGVGTDASISLARTLADTGALFIGLTDRHPEVRSYVYGPPGADWLATAYESPAGSDATIYTTQLPRPIPGGSPYTLVWSHGQLAPAVTDHATWPHPVCTAARTATDMVLSFVSGNDDPDEQSVDYGDAGGQRVSVTEDGATLTTENPQNPVLYPVHPGNHAYAVTVTENRGRLGFASSTYTTSRWNFQAAAGVGPRVPAAWQCADGPWTVLPMLTLHAAIPIAMDGMVPAALVRVPIAVGHTAAAAPTPVTRVRLSISTDGHTWTAEPVAAAGTRWAATLDLSHLAAGTVVSVRTDATDQAGSTLQQTTTKAFTVGGTA